MSYKILEYRRKHMSTNVSLRLSVPADLVPQADAALARAHILLSELEDLWSEFREHSDTARINNASPGKSLRVDARTIELLQLSARLEQETDGAFSPLVKSQVPVAGIKAEFSWDPIRGEVSKNRAGVKLGFGAIGKGAALDLVRVQLEQAGFHDYILDVGGSSLIISGLAAPGQPWDWAWSWQTDALGDPVGIPFVHSSGKAIAIGVSGLESRGKHIFDPLCGTVADKHRSAFVAESSAARADALSTALFVMGWEKTHKKLLTAIDPPALAIIDHDHVPTWNGRFQELWGAVVCLMIFLSSSVAFADDDSVDLSALGISDFTPYIVERNSLWVLLPLAMLCIVFWHLPFPWRKKSKR